MNKGCEVVIIQTYICNEDEEHPHITTRKLCEKHCELIDDCPIYDNIIDKQNTKEC
jgi:hypothetical protein